MVPSEENQLVPKEVSEAGGPRARRAAGGGGGLCGVWGAWGRGGGLARPGPARLCVRRREGRRARLCEGAGGPAPGGSAEAGGEGEKARPGPAGWRRLRPAAAWAAPGVEVCPRPRAWLPAVRGRGGERKGKKGPKCSMAAGRRELRPESAAAGVCGRVGPSPPPCSGEEGRRFVFGQRLKIRACGEEEG